MKVLARNQVTASAKQIRNCIVDFYLLSGHDSHISYKLSEIGAKPYDSNRVRFAICTAMNNVQSVVDTLNKSKAILSHDWEIEKKKCNSKTIAVYSKFHDVRLEIKFDQHSDVIGQKIRLIDGDALIRIRATKDGTYPILIWEDDFTHPHEDNWLNLDELNSAFGFDFKPEDFKK